MPTIIYKPELVRISAESHEPMIELNFAMKALFDWFLGRGVWRMKINLDSTVDKSCVIQGEALVPGGAMRLTDFVGVGEAVQEGAIPLDIPKAEWFDVHSQDVVISSGQHRIRLNTNKDRTEHIVVNYEANPTAPIGTVSMVTSGLITGLFAKGVREFKYQFSQKRRELLARHGVDRRQFLEYLALNESGQPLYSWDDPVSKLS